MERAGGLRTGRKVKADSGEPAFKRGWQDEESGTFRFWKVRCSLSCVTLEEACAVSPKLYEGRRKRDSYRLPGTACTGCHPWLGLAWGDSVKVWWPAAERGWASSFS